MSEQKTMIARFVTEVLSGTGRPRDYLAPDFVDHDPFPGCPPTAAGFEDGLAAFRAAFPDLRLEVERLVEEGDTVVGLFRMTGTHRGPFMGAPPTGRTFRIQAIDMVRVRDGKIAEHWGALDGAALAAQLGLAG